MGYFLSKIKEARLLAGLSQAKAGELAGVTRENFNSFENGKRTIPYEALMRLAKGLGVPEQKIKIWQRLDGATELEMKMLAKEILPQISKEELLELKKQLEEMTS